MLSNFVKGESWEQEEAAVEMVGGTIVKGGRRREAGGKENWLTNKEHGQTFISHCLTPGLCKEGVQTCSPFGILSSLCLFLCTQRWRGREEQKVAEMYTGESIFRKAVIRISTTQCRT